MNIKEIIQKKSLGFELDSEEIHYFVSSFLKNQIKECQASSLLMAIKLKGMSNNEMLEYLDALIKSGNQWDFPDVNYYDKHSTGGIGDKVSLIIVPLFKSLGLKMGMVSGKYLGWTGGTINKLQSIKGFKTAISKEEYHNLLKEKSMALGEATKDLAPGDKIIYSLRDETSTVDSLPLIAASIMSKKIASGSKNIILEIKVGKGAFMKTIDDGKELGILMKDIAKRFNIKLYILYTNMSSPLGDSIGNGIEIDEVRRILSGEKNIYNQQLRDLIIEICSIAYVDTYNETTLDEARTKVKRILDNGESVKYFDEYFLNQGADKSFLNQKDYFKPKYKIEIRANKNGYFNYSELTKLGFFNNYIAFGPNPTKPKNDIHAGTRINVLQGEKINEGDLLFEVFSSNPLNEKEAFNKINESYEISDSKPFVEEIILDRESW